MTSRDVRRVLGRLGLLAWLLVGVPIALSGAIAPVRLVVWAVAFIGFGAAFWGATRLDDGWWRRVGLPALEVVCAVAMVAVLCDGMEVLLLSLVAFQLGRWARPGLGVSWVVVQSLLASGAMAAHWSIRAALMFGPPHFAFQLLAYASARLTERIAAERAERARLEERLELSRELHDIAGHRLTALSLNLQVLQRTAPAALRERIDAAHTLADDLLAEVRRTVEAFRRQPRGPAGAEQLRALGDRIPRPRVHVSYRDDLAIDDPRLANTVLRCVQEIVTNAARHANAENLWIDVTSTDRAFAVHARDDGCGITDLVEGNGLRGMRERLAELGGDLEIESHPGAGTVLAARIPLRPS
jgi:signal transduction histidine kinase